MADSTSSPLVMVLDGFGPETVAETRLAIRELLGDAGVAALAPTVALLTTELVADAVTREPTALILYADCDRRHVRVEVGETGESRERAVDGHLADRRSGEARTADALRSRLLDELADGWGGIRSAEGGLVWFDVGIRTPV